MIEKQEECDGSPVRLPRGSLPPALHARTSSLAKPATLATVTGLAPRTRKPLIFSLAVTVAIVPRPATPAQAGAAVVATNPPGEKARLSLVRAAGFRGGVNLDGVIRSR